MQLDLTPNEILADFVKLPNVIDAVNQFGISPEVAFNEDKIVNRQISMVTDATTGWHMIPQVLQLFVATAIRYTKSYRSKNIIYYVYNGSIQVEENYINDEQAIQAFNFLQFLESLAPVGRIGRDRTYNGYVYKKAMEALSAPHKRTKRHRHL